MLTGWFNHVIQCITLPMSAPACRPFWETTMYACAVIGVALIAWLAWKWFDQPLKPAARPRAGTKREPVTAQPAARPHATAEPEDIASDVTDPHLAKKIRAEIEQRRMKNLRG